MAKVRSIAFTKPNHKQRKGINQIPKQLKVDNKPILIKPELQDFDTIRKNRDGGAFTSSRSHLPLPQRKNVKPESFRNTVSDLNSDIGMVVAPHLMQEYMDELKDFTYSSKYYENIKVNGRVIDPALVMYSMWENGNYEARIEDSVTLKPITQKTKPISISPIYTESQQSSPFVFSAHKNIDNKKLLSFKSQQRNSSVMLDEVDFSSFPKDFFVNHPLEPVHTTI